MDHPKMREALAPGKGPGSAYPGPAQSELCPKGIDASNSKVWYEFLQPGACLDSTVTRTRTAADGRYGLPGLGKLRAAR